MASQAELQAMKLSELKARLRSSGVSNNDVDQLDWEDNPKAAAIELLLQAPAPYPVAAPPTAPPPAEVDADLAGKLGKIVVIAGPPAGGKGTQSKMLQERLGHVHISTGDIFREAAEQGTELGKQAADFMARDQFVPDKMVVQMVKDYLAKPDIQAKGCLLDGFPRTPEQAQALSTHIQVDRFVLLHVPEKVSVERALDRRMDPATGAIYNLKSVPPPASVVASLIRRSNDCDEPTVKARVQTYTEHKDKILQYFTGKIQRIDGTKDPEQVYHAIVQGVDDPTAFDEPGEEDEWGDEDEDENIVNSVQLSLDVSPAEDVPAGADSTSSNVVVSVKVPEGDARVPADVCCVVDISASMGTMATYETETGETKQADGLTILDIVKHAVRTVMHMLKDNDRFSMVAFDHESELVFPLKEMTEVGRKQAESALDNLRPRGRTNIWGGVHSGMESIKTPGETKGRRKAILLLTDGQPNVQPPRGHIPELKDYKELNAGFGFQINTFGFGNGLDSELLLDLAVEGGGTYAFIPDAAIVGTCFVNSTANILSTQTQSSTVHLLAKGGASFAGQPLGGLDCNVADWGRVVNLGTLQFGQSREIVIPMSIPAGATEYLEVVATYPDANGKEIKCSTKATARTATKGALAALARVQSVDVGSNAIQTVAGGNWASGLEAAREIGATVTSLCETPLGNGNEALLVLKEDVCGRLEKGMSTQERFNRWGKHYSRALIRAHQLQLCTNFMDPGLQVYGGTLFKEIKDEGGQIFVQLPPPKPSRQAPAPVRTSTTTASTPAPAANTNMNTYYAGTGGGCFGATSEVIVTSPEGAEVATCMRDVRAGQLVRVADGGVARVLCAVRVARPTEKRLVSIGGLQITGKHPIRRDGVWQLPEDTPEAKAVGGRVHEHDGYVYNLVMDRCHILLVNGVECITWGHGFGGAVVEHSYYGTGKIVEDLMALDGWQHGQSTIQLLRNTLTWEVDSLQERMDADYSVEDEPTMFESWEDIGIWGSAPVLAN